MYISRSQILGMANGTKCALGHVLLLYEYHYQYTTGANYAWIKRVLLNMLLSIPGHFVCKSGEGLNLNRIAYLRYSELIDAAWRIYAAVAKAIIGSDYCLLKSTYICSVPIYGAIHTSWISIKIGEMSYVSTSWVCTQLFHHTAQSTVYNSQGTLVVDWRHDPFRGCLNILLERVGNVSIGMTSVLKHFLLTF